MPIFGLRKSANVDNQLGPEMKSTGESIRFVVDMTDPFFRELDKNRSQYLTR